MIHCVLHDPHDSVAVVVVENLKAGTKLTGLVLDLDRTIELDARFPLYGFARHKGYGTPEHLAALARHGPCAAHRRSFAPIKQPEPGLF